MSGASPLVHHFLCITSDASSLVHHLWCITSGASPLMHLWCMDFSDASLIHPPSSYLTPLSHIIFKNIAHVGSFSHFVFVFVFVFIFVFATPAAAHTFPFLNNPSFLVLKRGHRLAQKLAIVGLDSQTLPKSSLVGAFTLGKGSVTVPVFSPCASSVPKPSYPSKDTKTPG